MGVVMLFLSSPLLATLALGQVYPVLALGLVAAWVADRREREEVSGAALGLVVALKPSLLPVLLWPLARQRWRAFVAAVVSGAVVTLIGVVILGPGATLDYIGVLRDRSVSAYWDNASIPSAAARLFTENPYAQNVATLPWMVPVGYALGIAAIVLTAIRVRHGRSWVVGPRRGLASRVAHRLAQLPGVARSRCPAAVGAGHGGTGFLAARVAVYPGAVAPASGTRGARSWPPWR